MKIDRKESYRKLLNMAYAYLCYEMSCDMAYTVEGNGDNAIVNESLKLQDDCKFLIARADIFPVSKGIEICKSIYQDVDIIKTSDGKFTNKNVDFMSYMKLRWHNAITITRDYLEGHLTKQKYRKLIHEYVEYEGLLTSKDIRQIFTCLRQLRDYIRKFEPNF